MAVVYPGQVGLDNGFDAQRSTGVEAIDQFGIDEACAFSPGIP